MTMWVSQYTQQNSYLQSACGYPLLISAFYYKTIASTLFTCRLHKS